MSSVNALANSLSSFPVLSEPLQSGYGVYPGDTWCQPQEQCCHEYLVKTDGIPNIFGFMEIFECRIPNIFGFWKMFEYRIPNIFGF